MGRQFTEKKRKPSTAKKSKRLLSKRIWKTRTAKAEESCNFNSQPFDDGHLFNEWTDITPTPSTSLEQSTNEIIDQAAEEMELDQELYIETHTPEENNAFSVAGGRIIDIMYFLERLQGITHPGLDCNLTNMNLIGESRMGLRSIFTFKCKMCGVTEKVPTENPDAELNVNMVAVSGALSVGIGYSQTNELLSAMDIPCMADTTYQRYFEKVSVEIKHAAWEEIQNAAKEEAELAKAAGDVNSDGIPVITVIADGAWSKRSYRTNYNAASGVACVIGAKTKKIIFLGVRNKYCIVCFKESYYKERPSDHVCYKNWCNSSTAMESDIILEAFKRSIDMQGLIYGRLIGDGDSNVYSKIISASPYGPAFHIQKVECKNHLLRNYVSKLSDLKTNTAYNIEGRKMVEAKIEKLRLAVTGAVNYWFKSEEDLKKKIINLKEDLLNGPHHVFGDHEKCRDYFCSEEKKQAKLESGEENQISFLKNFNIYEEMMKRTRRIADNSWSLLHNMDNNLAESYNSVVAKFIGGKRINFSLKGSYETRCTGAALSFNNGGNYHEVLQKKINKFGPGKFTKTYCEKMKKKRLYNSKRRVFKKRRHKVAGPDLNYGISIEDYPDMDEETFSIDKNKFLQQISKVDAKQLEIDTREQAISELWKRERKLRLTASNFVRICCMRPTTSTAKTVESLLYSKFLGNEYTAYGNENEQNAVNAFEAVYGIKTKIIGLWVDREKPYLAASPDRVCENGNGILEIKCPASCKNLTPQEGVLQKKIKFCKLEGDSLKLNVTHKYMYQVQGQLEIANKEICYFIVWTTKGVCIEEIRRDREIWHKMCFKLDDFYFNSLLPEPIDSRRLRNLPTRDVYLKGAK